jgi:hypothetical protein
MRKLFFSLIIGLLVSSCATHYGTISSNAIEKRIKYVDMAIGVSQTKKIFGIGAMTKDALVLDAKREMIKNRPLQPGEQYVNFTLDFKNSYWPIIRQTQVILSADVVKFIPDTATAIYSGEYLKIIGDGNFVNELFSIGDTILLDGNPGGTIFDAILEGTILSVQSNDKVKILYKTIQNNYRIKTCSIDQIYVYKTSKSFRGYRVDESYASEHISSEEKIPDGYVYGLGLNKILIKRESGEVLRVKYSK